MEVVVLVVVSLAVLLFVFLVFLLLRDSDSPKTASASFGRQHGLGSLGKGQLPSLRTSNTDGVITNFAYAQSPGSTTVSEEKPRYALGPVRDVYFQAQSPGGDPYLFEPCFVWLPPETLGVKCYYKWEIQGPDFLAQSPPDGDYEHNNAKLHERDHVLRDGIYELSVQPFVVDHPDQFGPPVHLQVYLQFTPGPVHNLAYNPSTQQISWQMADPGADSEQPIHYEITIKTPMRVLVHETSINATNFPLPDDGPGQYIVEITAVNYYGKGPTETVSVGNYR